jgi:hypothetical protein
MFVGVSLDILKIDVEGYEEVVLRGAANLLSDAQRGPRLIYIEVHPYAWPAVGTTSTSLLGLLEGYNYRIVSLADLLVENIRGYGEVVAIRKE